KGILEFRHRYFRKNRSDLLEKIQHKIGIKTKINEFMGPNYYNPNKIMCLQKQLIKSIASSSQQLQSLHEKTSMLKQMLLKKNGIKRFKNPKAILFEEDICSRIRLNTLLKKAGFDIYLAGSGNNLVFKCSKKNFELIILSSNMLNILAILKKAKSFKRRAAIILTYSYNGIRSDLNDFKRMGVDEFLLKPYTEEHFISIIKKLTVSRDSLNFLDN
ncbi:MAG: response regulator, partial [Rickettsia endosymbiont of Ixodes persulcatus]|nr:response regulator [Rickettsia endosymbiont of Ixodes persulcatus]